MKKYIFLILILSISVFAFSQTDTEFWFVAPEVSADHGDDPVLLRITTTNLPADVTISMPANTVNFPNLNYNIAANTTITINLTALGLQGEVEHYYDFLDGVNGKSNRGIRIQSTNPVTVYYEVRRGNNCDIFALKGGNALGTEFYAVFQNKGYNMSGSGWGAPAYSALEIVAVEDGTEVTFESTQGQRFFGYGIGTYSVILNRGESLSLVPDWTTDVPTGSGLPTCNLTKYGNDVFGRAGADRLSGVRITSDKDITIIKKDDSVRYYCVDGWSGGCYDLIGDQMVPLDILGFEYIAMKGSLTTAPENVYVVATEDNTNIYINGVGAPVTNIDEGETYVYELWDSGNDYVHIRGDKKLSVLHVSGFGCEVGGAILPPIDKCTGSTNLSVTRSTTEAFFFNLMVWNGAEDEFYIDGVLQDGSPGTLFGPGDFDPVPGSANWLIWRSGNLPTGDFPAGGTFNFQNTEDVFHLGLINGGGTSGCRFGYFSDFNELRVNAEATGSGSGEIKACGYDQIQLYSSGGTTFNWFPSEYLSDPTIATPIADPPPGTTTLFYVEVSGACGLTDTATVTVKKFPHVEAQFAVDKGNGCSPLEIEFHETSTQVNERYWDFNFSNIGGMVDTETILFGDNNNYDTDTIFTHLFENTSNEPDDSIQNYQIRLLVKNSNDCTDTAYASVLVYPEVTADFMLTDLNDTIGCNPLDVSFVDNSNNEDYYYWTFGDGVSSTTQNPSHQFTNIANDTTTYNTRLIVRSDYFCRDTADIDIKVFPYLESGFTIDKHQGCSPLEVTFTNNSVYEDSVELVLGDGNVVNSINFTTYLHNYVNTGITVDTNAVELRVYNDEGCYEIWRDTIIVYPEITANYNIDGNNYIGCNTRDVEFTNTSNYGPHEASEFLWTFGDGTNSNTTAVDVPHTYTNSSNDDKIYTFTLKAESQYGCWDDTTNQIQINRAFADYIIDNDEGCSPLPVTITNTSVGNQITTWEWQFDDGSPVDNNQTPAINPHTYTNTTGDTITRDLRLTVTGTNGCSTFKEVPINVFSSIDVGFTPDNPTGCDSMVVNFNSTINHGTVNKYTWNFGDGTSSNVADPNKVYRNLSSTGDVTYNAQLLVETAEGCIDTESTTVTVHPYVNAKFTVDTVVGCSPLSVDPIATSYPGIATYRWDFGDGTPVVTGQNPPAHTYPVNTSGGDVTYILELEVIDPSGNCNDIATKTITVYSEAIADFDPKNSTGCNPYTITFDNLSPFTATSTYKWDFDDGGATSSAFEPTYTFNNTTNTTKTYQVELEVTSNRGCTDVFSSNVNVNRYVNADFDVDITEDCSPLTVTIDNNSRGGNYRWYWNSQTAVGAADRTSISGTETFTHEYTNTTGSDITFYLTLVAENTSGCTDTLTREILVHSSITADFSFVQNDACNPSDVVFTNESSGGGSYTMNWNFGDGSSLTTSSSPVNKTFTNNSTNDRTYTVVMTAESENGCTDSHTDYITVYSKLIADFSIEENEGCPAFTTTIQNTSIGNAANTYQWLVDGIPEGPTNKDDFTHTYENSTTSLRPYQVRLVAENAHGCSSEYIDTVTVYEYVKASYDMDIEEGCTPLEIQFSDLSLVPASTKYTWNFGDGATSGSENPKHTFYNSSRETDKPYSIKLTVQSPNYCTHDTTQNIMVFHQPLSKFFIDNTSSCPPLVSYMEKESIGEDMFEWRFGDETYNTTDQTLTHTYPNTLVDVVQNYTLELWVGTNEGCKDSTSLELNVFPDVIADFTYDDAGCSPFVSSFNNESTSPAQYFYWNFDDGNTSNQENPVHRFTNTWNTDRTYNVFLKASSEYNCWDTITKPVTAYAQPIVEFDVSPSVQKFPENRVFIDNKSNDGPFDYLWEFGDLEETTSTENEPNYFDYEHWGEKDITLTITSQTSDCNDNLTKSVTILPPDINADFTTNIDGGCLDDGLDVEFTAAASVYSEVYNYAWEFGDGETGTGAEITHTYAEPGTYYVKLTATGEGGEDYQYKTIRVYSNPEANFELLPNVTMIDAETLEARVEFYNQSSCNDTSGCSYLWNFGDGNTSIATNVTHYYEKPPDDEIPKEFDITLTVSNSQGCVDSLVKEKAVKIIGEGEIDFPNAFTPNEDGINDTFKPVAKGVIKYELLIYNRWGELIFKTNDLDIGWDGKIGDHYAKSDVYVWKATGNFSNGRAFELAGDVTLIR